MTTDAQTLLDKITDFQGLTSTPSVTVTPKHKIDQLYGILGILDTKANGLLLLNSIFIVVFGGLFTLSLEDKVQVPAPPLCVDLIALVSFWLFLISSIFCLLIGRIAWDFLGKVEKSAGKPADYDKEIEALAEVAVSRTHRFQKAWWCSLLGLIFFALVGGFAIVGKVTG